MRYIDIHTHHSRRDSLISCSPHNFQPQKALLYTIGIHPWHLHESTEKDWLQLQDAAQHPQVKAIGETGLDKCIPTPISEQLTALTRHKEIAETLHKPLILHLVKSFSEFLAWQKQTKPQIPLIIHGFRGKPQLAQQLLKAHCYLSFGAHYTQESLLQMPLNRLFLETDESTLPITAHYQNIAQALNLSENSLIQQIEENYNNLF